MKDRICAIYAKYGDILRYLIIGAITTLIDVVSFALFNGVIGWYYLLSKAASWVLAVAFAFVGNKWIVFRARSMQGATLIGEIGSFVAMRLVSLAINAGLLFAAVEWLGWGETLSNALSTFIVILVNYVLSKAVVFRQKGQDNTEKAL